jgi:hypothetical protein
MIYPEVILTCRLVHELQDRLMQNWFIVSDIKNQI